MTGIPKVTSRDNWLILRKTLLAKEIELTRARRTGSWAPPHADGQAR